MSLLCGSKREGEKRPNIEAFLTEMSTKSRSEVLVVDLGTTQGLEAFVLIHFFSFETPKSTKFIKLQPPGFSLAAVRIRCVCSPGEVQVLLRLPLGLPSDHRLLTGQGGENGTGAWCE